MFATISVTGYCRQEFGHCNYKIQLFWIFVKPACMQSRSTKKKPVVGKPAPNPTYVKIGKRIRQARLMAKESNSRQLSQRLGWSAGRINNFELGVSTPGPEETQILCEALKTNPAWVTYGVGSPRTSDLDSTRYRNLMTAVEEAEASAELLVLLAALKLSVERLEKLRANPFKKIPDTMARRCERHLNKPRGWLGASRIEDRYCEPLPPDMRDLLDLYVQLSKDDRRKLYEMGRILLGGSHSAA
jgi:transcriptional regulator with XRE-family HTH domain